MTDALARAKVMRWVDDSFPGWIEVVVTDATGRNHHIVDKVPVLTTLDVAPDTTLPDELWIDVDAAPVDKDRVVAKLKYVDTRDGLNELILSVVDVRQL
jgi:hypothetical protein